jgi:hypothetical protein
VKQFLSRIRGQRVLDVGKLVQHLRYQQTAMLELVISDSMCETPSTWKIDVVNLEEPFCTMKKGPTWNNDRKHEP